MLTKSMPPASEIETAPDVPILGPRTANWGFYFAAEGGQCRKLMNDSWRACLFQANPVRAVSFEGIPSARASLVTKSTISGAKATAAAGEF